jgi:alpha-tubulin suppressor-like RCC1 family protein
MVLRGREQVDVYSWGRGDLGQLGTSTDVCCSGTPTLVAGLHDRGVVHMAGSLFHSVALTGEFLSDGWIVPRCSTCRCS